MELDLHGIEIGVYGSVHIRRRRWHLGVAALRGRGARGACLSPKRPNLPRFVVVSRHLAPGSPKHLEALVHETLHAALPELSEADVVAAAHAIAKVLGKSGYRK